MYTDAELAGYGWTAYHLGEPVDAAVVQADHAEYRGLSAADLPGITVLVDGRRVTDPAQFAGVVRRVLGTA
jgi:UDP-N-acetyl-D-mannosaminuronate dehydrogenase